MSSILKALRKVEEEKRATSHAAPDFRSAQSNSAPRTKPFLSLLSGMILGVSCVLVVYFLLSDERTKTPPQPEQVVQQPVKVTEPQALQLEQKTIPVVVMQSEPVAAIQPARKHIKPTVEPSAQAAVSVPVAGAKANPAPVTASRPDVTSKKYPESAIEQALPEGVTLVVSEIFYQDDAANSMAVVNDLPVMVGMPVDNALVSEILPDHVVFVVGDKHYLVTPAAQ